MKITLILLSLVPLAIFLWKIRQPRKISETTESSDLPDRMPPHKPIDRREDEWNQGRFAPISGSQPDLLD
jgi:hypothetical protein